MDRHATLVEPLEIKLQRNFSKQYFCTYSVRLQTQYPVLLNKIQKIYKNTIPIKNISDISQNEKCVIIGTLYKEMKKKPSVLKVLDDDCKFGTRITNMRDDSNFISDSDKLFLEDSNQRIQILSKTTLLQTDEVVTGITVALIGLCENEDRGEFIVEDAIFPGPNNITNNNLIHQNGNNKTEKTGRYVLLISGLNLGSEKGDKVSEVWMKFLSEWISGKLGNLKDSINVEPEEIGRVFILGDSVSISSSEQENYILTKLNPKSSNNLSISQLDKSASILSRLDTLLADTFCSIIPVDLLASSHLGHDASIFSSSLLPQPSPVSLALFPKSANWASFNTRISPFHCLANQNLRISMTTGESLLDISRFTSPNQSCLSRIKSLLIWGHLAPTCPDTLPASPLVQSGDLDPLVFPWFPNVFIAGNQSEYVSQMVDIDSSSRCLCVGVPVFSETCQVVLLDCENLCTKLIDLKSD